MGIRALIAAALTLALVAGCGDEDDEPDQPGGNGGSTELEITLNPDGPGGQEARTETVECEAGAGNSPCETLAATDLAPIDPSTPCTDIYGGPDEVTVEGQIAGEDVSASLTRVNGCEIDRFESVVPLLQELFPGYRPGRSVMP